MVWSAALGLAGNIYAANQASADAAAARADQRYMQDRQMELANTNIAMQLAQDRERRENNAYNRQIEQMNRGLAADERRYQQGLFEDYKQTLMDERREQRERQILEDKEAARLATFRMEQILRNEDISQQERDFAITQLNEAKAIAAGERDEDLRRFLEERDQKEIERDFVVREYDESKRQTQLERQEAMARQDNIIAQIARMQGDLASAQSAMGLAPEIEQITQADFDREYERRVGDYMGDVDRAADRVASIGESDLIRRGMDLSTQGTARRGEIAGRIANEYTTARQKARDDAIKYITGQSNAMTKNVNDILGRRGTMLKEVAGVSGAGIDQLSRLGFAPSAANVYRNATSVPTSVYNRAIGSANNFRSPVSIGSAIYDSQSPLASTANYMVNASAATPYNTTIGSGIMNPGSMNLGSINGFGNASSIFNNAASSAASFYDSMRGRAADASRGVGSNLNDILKDNSSSIDDYFNKKFGMGKYDPFQFGDNRLITSR